MSDTARLESTVTRPYVALLGASLLFFSFAAYHFAPASTTSYLVDRFAISKPEVGLTISSTYLGWLLFQLPGGFVLDRVRNGALMRIGGLALVVAVAVPAIVERFPVLLAVRLLGGLVGGLIFGAGTTITGRIFPSERRGLATSLFISSGPAGVAVTQYGGPLIAASVGWSWIFVAWAGVAVAGLVVFHLALDVELRTDSSLSVGKFVRALSDRTVLLVALASLITNGLFIFLNSWMPTYGTEQLSLTPADAGLLSALIPVAAVLARPSGGFLSDALGRRPVVVISLVPLLPLLLVVPLLSGPLVYAGALFLAGFILQLSAGVYFVYVQELADPEVSATSITVVTTAVILGGTLSPVLGGWLIEAASWRVAFAVYGGAALIGVAAALGADRGGPR